ncbi:MAG: hypothetical protein LBV36_03445 [Chromatiales bacterium]|jgi:hypothetical protein|nr:hypothetical protein [Chromatiales bacterium]
MAAAVDGVPAWKSGPSGVYIWREANGSWQMRLNTADGKSQNFSGGFSVAGKSFSWVSNLGIEGNDTVKSAYPGQVETGFTVGGSDYIDGITFGVPAGAGVCMWGWGSMGKVVYLGAKAARATLPVDLLDSGACGGAGASNAQMSVNNTKPATTPAASTSTNTKRKYNPGHYIALNDWDGATQMIEAVKPGVRGFNKRYRWIDLEPTQGNYNFAQIQADLTVARDHGMQLVVMIEDKSFSPGLKITPRYLWPYTLPYTAGGEVSKRWDPLVVARMAALTSAMGARFDSHPSFEGVAFQETAMGFTPAIQQQSGYTPEKYRDAIITMLSNARKSFPTSQVFWYMNYLEGKQAYLGQIASAVVPLGIVMGGPDVLPDSWQLNYHSYPFFKQFKGKMKMFNSIQYDSYKHQHATKGYATKYWTTAELFRFARDNLNVNYLFWTRKPVPDPRDSYDWTYALPVIRNNPVFNQ